MGFKPKKYTTADIIKKYRALTRQKQLLVLWEALDLLEAGKVKRKWTAVIWAMGFRPHPDEENLFLKLK